MRKAIHLIPFCGVGGVERAAATMFSVRTAELDFKVQAIFPFFATARRFGLWNPTHLLRCTYSVFKVSPDLLVVSLWRSCAVGLLVKLMRPRTCLVLFLHFPDDVHGLDRLLTRLIANFSTRIWADCGETLTKRLPRPEITKQRVISFVTERFQALPMKAVRPAFIFWGRIHTQKGLNRALSIFHGILAREPAARFIVIGPDGGDLARIKAIVEELRLESNVSFEGALEFSEIRKLAEQASFYIQTSELEGMAMSVVEAMQLGLLPVVTPVGEIKNYAQHGKNALVVTDDATTIDDILALIQDDARYQAIRERAVATWAHQPLYKDSVLEACREALAMGKTVNAA